MQLFPRHAPPLLLAVLAACGGAGQAESIRRQLALGRLDVAEDLLQTVEGEQADLLAVLLADMRARRESVAAALEDFRDRRGSQLGTELQDELGRMLAPEADPVIREWIQREASATADWVAERNSKRPLRRIWLPGLGLAAPTAAGEPEQQSENAVALVRAVVDDPLLEALLADVAAAERDGSWQQALALVDTLLADAPALGARLSRRRAELLERAALDAQTVLLSAQRTERQSGADEARTYLAGELWRFPDRGGAASLHRKFETLGSLDDETETAWTPPGAGDRPPDAPDVSVSDVAGMSVEPGTSARMLADRAALESAQDHLAAAADLWRAAVERSDDDELRTRYELAAWDAEQRRGLRAALAGAFAADPSLFRDLGADSIGVEEIEWGGASITWRDLSWKNLVQLHERAERNTDRETDLALTLEKLQRGMGDGPRGGLADLARLMDRGVIERRRCWALVAAWRSEPVPGGGYTFRGGVWHSPTELERARLGAEVDELARKLERESGAAREDAFERFAALARGSVVASKRLASALGTLRQSSVEAVDKGRTMEQLTRIERLRSQLDASRGHALELIFDTQTYFYPYDPPADPEKTVSDYWKAQREVDSRVSAVRETWEIPIKVDLPPTFRRALEDLAWIRACGSSLGWGSEEYELPAAWPTWIGALDPGRDSVTLASFAWDVRERDAFARDRAVRARNEALWKRDWPTPGAEPGTGEKNQVRITNAYREMLGRGALAWNPAVQVAAQWHADYMANTGRFGHFEPEIPERRTNHDRLLAAGYARGTAENCHRGGGDPKGAHDAWVQSSGHHRNILRAAHREMASALASKYWTQDFGNGDEFESELDEWRD